MFCPDIPHESAFLRAALLLGLVREGDVHTWGDALLASEGDEHGLIADVVLCPPELTALRECLRPLAVPANDADVASALLAFLAVDPVASQLSTMERLRVLSQMRRELPLPTGVQEELKEMEDRAMLAAASVGDARAPDCAELDRWLASVRPHVCFRVLFERDGEPAAFVAALSRAVHRTRRLYAPDGEGGLAWLVAATPTRPAALVLNERLRRMAVDAFGPLPIGSRIPYVASPPGDAPVIDEARVEALGADDASARMAR